MFGRITQQLVTKVNLEIHHTIHKSIGNLYITNSHLQKKKLIALPGAKKISRMLSSQEISDIKRGLGVV